MTTRTLAIATLAALLAACSTTKQTENLLTAAGFKIVPATTPAQQEHLASLPEGKLTKVIKDGREWVVYPDAKQEILYVGGYDAYHRYEKYRMEQNLAEAGVEEAEMTPAWGAWGPWPGVGGYAW